MRPVQPALRSYTYEVCLFGEAKQIPNKGGSTFSLGSVSLIHYSDARTYIFCSGNLLPGTRRQM